MESFLTTLFFESYYITRVKVNLKILIVKLEIIQVFSTNSLKKKFPVENFIHQFPKKEEGSNKKINY